MRGVILGLVLALSACVTEPERADPEIRTIQTAPGVTLHTAVYGNGPNVVIVPGRLFFEDSMRGLAAPDRTLVLYDMRNRGASSPVADGDTINITEDVRDLEAIRAELGAERVSLIGYSYLGLMVALYAAEHPDRVDRLVQIGPAQRKYGTPVPQEWAAGAETLSREGIAAQEVVTAAADANLSQIELCRAQRAALRYWLVGDPANAERVPDTCVYENELPEALARHFGFHFADLQTRDFPPAMFEELAQPTLIVHGTLDRNAPYGSGREWAAVLPNARLITVDGGAHNVWLEDDNVIPNIDEFLRGTWPSRAQDLH